MLSTILQKFIANVNELVIVQGLPLSKPVAFAESWTEQGVAREIRVRPLKGRGGGPNFYDQQVTTIGMVRKVWTTIEIQCWGLPDPNGSLVNNTDDTERLRQIVIVALNQAISGGYRYLGETWNQQSEVMMYGRCLTMHVELEQPIADIQPYLTTATLTAINLTATETLEP